MDEVEEAVKAPRLAQVLKDLKSPPSAVPPSPPPTHGGTAATPPAATLGTAAPPLGRIHHPKRFSIRHPEAEQWCDKVPVLHGRLQASLTACAEAPPPPRAARIGRSGRTLR